MNMRTRLTALVLALLMFISTPVSAWATTVDANTYAQWLQDAQAVSAQQQKMITTSEEILTTTDVTYTGTATNRNTTFLNLTGTTSEDTTLPQQSITLPVAGSATLYAPSGAESYQWQVYVSGVWANILGDTAASITMTYPMLSNALSGNSALVRCRMEQSGATVYSAETQVTVDHTITTTAYTTTRSIPVQATEYTTTRSANSGIMLLATEPQQTYLITIQYLFKDGTPAANPVIIQTGSSSGTQTYTGTVALPKVTGYDVGTPKDLPTGVTYNATNATLQFTNFSVTENKNITITYVPALVSYTVVYWQQKVGGDSNEDYEKVEKDTRQFQGYTGDTVATDLAPGDKYHGFRPLLYDTGTPIAADGSTVVNVKYDREYYLIKFNLDGGTGVDPIYAQFGAPYNVNEPTRAGYSFAGWDPALPAVDERTIPYNGATYTAQWNANETSFTVVYWLDDPNDNTEDLEKRKYNYWGSSTQKAKSGTIVDGATYQDYKKIANYQTLLNPYEVRYSTYSHADKNVTIKGDGSSVVNVYYKRNVYEMRFYYAMEDASGTPYVVGGSTYYFGNPDSNTGSIPSWVDKDDEISLLSRFLTNGDYAKGTVGIIENLPQLTEEGLRRYGSTKTVSDDAKRKYHYFSFSAKYGADLSDLWPVVNVMNSITPSDPANKNYPASMSAWNGEYRVYYSQHNTNQTIKGVYSQLDYQILWDNNCNVTGHPSGDSDVVSFLCFWENGANIGWSIPELYRYYIYVPALSNESIDKTYNGIDYHLHSCYDTVDNSSVEEQTAPAIAGFSYPPVRTSRKMSDSEFDTSKYTEAHEVYFFYNRLPYNLELHNAGTTDKHENVLFGRNIAEYVTTVPEHPDESLRATHEFGGWYLDPDCVEGTEFYIDQEPTMPAHNLMLYAKWNLVKHHVNVYLTKAHMEAGSEVDGELLYSDTVEHGTLIPELSRPQTPVNGSYNFVHWFYEVENDDGTITEHPFDFASIPVIHDLNIYAKWSTDVVMNYKVYYVKKGTGEAIGDATEFVADLSAGSALAGTSKTFYAKGVTELYEAYQTGWFPETQSHTISIGIDEDKNSYTFKYVQVDKVPYQVCYVDENGNSLRDPVTVFDNDKAVVTENFVLIPGYVPDALQKRLVVAYDANADIDKPTEANTITFVYKRDEQTAMYVINHYLVDNAGNETLHSYQTSTATMTSDTPATVTANKLNLDGYHFSNVKCEIAEGDDQNTTFDKTYLSVTMKQGSAGFVMNLYYQEQTATINYLVASGCESMGSVSLASETLGVVTGTPVGSTPTANQGFKFVGWYSDADCTQPVLLGVNADNGTLTPMRNPGELWTDVTYYAKFVLNVADLTITKEVVDAIATDNFHPNANTEFSFLVQIGGKNYVGGYTVAGQHASTANGIITLKAGETASISDVTIGEAYTVVEQTLPMGYTCEDDTVRGTIQESSNDVTITNTYQVRSLTINKAVKGGDAPRGEVFYFNVTLPNGSYATLTDGSMQSTLTVANDQATVLLTAGQTVVISGIPYGAEYAVTEQAHADYSTGVAGASSGRLNTDVSMTFTNTYLYSHLTVTKKGMTQGSAIVHVKVADTTYSVVLNGDNNWTQTIAHLPIGATIDVQEATDWSWRYSKAPTIVHADKVTEGGSTADITNTQAETKWLDDESAQANIFSGDNN
ncbi:MAG: InlB B-repeat-containing protein [Clostridia bacterium]|nr:InlB B-repeat-containing protein [Clostridia bacterium]